VLPSDPPPVAARITPWQGREQCVTGEALEGRTGEPALGKHDEDDTEGFARLWGEAVTRR
jgi:hypothetical protein